MEKATDGQIVTIVGGGWKTEFMKSADDMMLLAESEKLTKELKNYFK